jgi:hypothetical protein
VKNEKNEKVNKHDYMVSTIHKDSICKILFPSSLHREGLMVKQIHAKMKFVSINTVYNLLKELIIEDRVFESKRKYFLRIVRVNCSVHNFGSWLYFIGYCNSVLSTGCIFDLSLKKIISQS